MTPKPESETDPWAAVRRYQRHVGGTFLSPVGGWCFWHEVDAARAAEAAQHQQALVDLRVNYAQSMRLSNETLADTLARLAAVEAERDHAMKCEADHMMIDHERIEALKAERDSLKAALLPFGELAYAYDPPEDDDHEMAWDRKPSLGQLRAARAALTPQGQSTDGETK